MELLQLQKHWEDWARRDPLRAILSDHGGRSVEDFFERGREEVAQRLQQVRDAGIGPMPYGRALDFGCGMGRLTQAFCEHFKGCDGVDIARPMLELAEQHNRHGRRCRYHLNAQNDLSMFPDRSFAFVYTALVLQHMRPRYALIYIREFFRLLAPGGVAMFQVPSELFGAGALPVEHPRSPLPHDGRRAELVLIDLPKTRTAGIQLKQPVRVKNVGNTTWPAARTADGRHQLVVANRWFDDAGNLVETEDGRTLLPRDVEPNESAELNLVFAAPQRPGHYVLEVDMLEDGVGRFAQSGGAETTLPLKVLPPPPDEAPVIQMYGIPKTTVIRSIEDAGLRLLQVEENNSAGSFWSSYTYMVTRPNG